MSRSEALELLRRHDPARALAPLPELEREALRLRISGQPVRQAADRRRLRRPLALGIALAVAASAGGAAWATGSWSPLGLFQSNPQHDNGGPGTLWDQHVRPGSLTQAATVDLPRVGAVRLWFADTAEHGWCAGLRLPSGAWVGTGKDRLDAGGTVPGCLPTRSQVNAAGQPVYVLNGFDYQEGDVDARSAGGSFWRIRYGLVAAPAVRVTDLVTGRSTRVGPRHVFALAIPDPNPYGQTPVHLVAYDASGRVVADDSRQR